MSEGVIQRYRSLQGKVLLALAGVMHFSSSTLHCAQGRHAGRILYSHSALTPVLVRYGAVSVYSCPVDDLAKADSLRNYACVTDLAKMAEAIKTGKLFEYGSKRE